MELRRLFKKCGRNADDENSLDLFVERRRSLTKDISSLCGPQRVYMPGAESLDAIDAILLADHPENVDLQLPSALPPALRDTQCIDGLPEIEYRLRVAQAASALHQLRLHRRLLQALAAKNQVHITNTQKTSTRTRSTFEKVKDKQAQAVETYQSSWKAIKALAPNEEFGRWKSTLQELNAGDVRGPDREGYETSASRHVPSWIWSTAIQTSTSAEDPDLNIALRVEWCKAQERANRYEEEVELVVEEMRRVLVTLKLNASDWDERAASFHCPFLDPVVVSGAIAYAYKQADVQRKLFEVFLNDWYDILRDQPHAASWLGEYPRPPMDNRRRLVNNVELYHPTSDPSVPEAHSVCSDDIGAIVSNTPINETGHAAKRARV